MAMHLLAPQEPLHTGIVLDLMQQTCSWCIELASGCVPIKVANPPKCQINMCCNAQVTVKPASDIS